MRCARILRASFHRFQRGVQERFARVQTLALRVVADRLEREDSARGPLSIEFLCGDHDLDRVLASSAARLSEAAFARVWDNPDDADYDRL